MTTSLSIYDLRIYSSSEADKPNREVLDYARTIRFCVSRIKIDPSLRARFNNEGYLLGNDGEFYIPEMLSIEEYRDKLLIFRPDKEGDGFHHQYWARDIEVRKEGFEGKRSQFLP